METFDKDELHNRMDKTLQSLEITFQGIRTSRATPSLLERIKADVYGTYTPIQQLASITTPEPRVLSVQVWDKEAVKPLEKAIRESSLGLNPMIDGCTIRITLPELTQERREELCKYASKCSEETRVALRSVRKEGQEAIKKMDKRKEITEDDRDIFLEELQKITDSYVAKVNTMLETKKAEIQRV